MTKDQPKAPELPEEKFYIPSLDKSVSAKDINEALKKAKE